MAAGHRLIEWGVVSPSKIAPYGLGDKGDPVYAHLAWLLNYEDGEHFMFGFRETDREKLKWLVSPHGLTIYKMLVIKWEAKVNGTDYGTTR